MIETYANESTDRAIFTEMGEPLFTLADPKTFWALAYVDEARAGRIELDQPAEVRLRSLPGEVFRGHVARIGIESDRVSEERRVYVACDQCPARFHLGEQTEITLTTSMLDEALLVPETAVIGFDGAKGTAWTVEDGELRLLLVSAVIIALIIYTMTMDKLREIATLKLIGAPDRRTIGLIVQQALAMGAIGFGALLITTIEDYSPRRVVMQPEDGLALAAVVILVCLLASGLGVRLALRTDPTTALGS